MYTLKKLSALLLVLCLLLSFAACAAGGDDNEGGSSTTSSTSGTTTTTASGLTYKVTIVNEQGEAIPGAMVQICSDVCTPAVADENGVATWQKPEDTYKISFLAAPEGYAVEEAYYFEGDATEMTITLKAAE